MGIYGGSESSAGRDTWQRTLLSAKSLNNGNSYAEYGMDDVKNTVTKAAVISATLVLSTALFSAAAFAQLPVDFSQTRITTTELRDDIYMLQGEGGNIVVAVAEDGLLVVDSQFAPLYGRIKTAIGAISPLPVRYLVNTHHHGRV